jgi:hypothetical protein
VQWHRGLVAFEHRVRRGLLLFDRLDSTALLAGTVCTRRAQVVVVGADRGPHAEGPLTQAVVDSSRPKPVRQPQEFAPALREAMASGAPRLIEVMVAEGFGG